MSLSTALYKLLIGPVELLFEVIFALFYRHTLSPAISIIFLSLAMNVLILPLYRRADAIQSDERAISLRLKPGIDHIKKTFRGDERFMMLQTYYRQNNYKPYYSLRNSLSLLLQIPFFIAAYNFLSHVYVLNGASLWVIRNLGSPDGLIKIGEHTINALPIIMTLINIAASMVYAKGLPKIQKLQLYGIPIIFLVLLYNSPSGLVFYWTLNNVFSLIKNIIYKLKNPKKFTMILCSATGFMLLAFLVFKLGNLTRRVTIFGVFFAICLQIPLILKVYKINKCEKYFSPNRTESQIFIICSLFICFLIGVLIPSAVIASSPGEFIEIEAFKTPLWYLLSSFLISAGTFLLWFKVFYSMATPYLKRVFTFLTLSCAAIAVLNYLVFSPDYGMMNNLLKYDNEISISATSQIANLLFSLILVLMLLVLFKKKATLIRNIGAIALVTIILMSGVNVSAINKQTEQIKKTATLYSSPDAPTIRLNKNGKNVVVIMLDRAIGRFFPYLLSEKPMLQEQFEGFTYYPNTFSYGAQTITGSPALYGGYEYIPDELQKRNDTLLKDKHNEALRVMPVTFAENGYDVTVCDPSFAGYSLIPDLRIYDDYPEVRAYNTYGQFSAKDSERIDFIRNRNFFLYGLFRVSPLAIQKTVYDIGRYNELIEYQGYQVLSGLSKAEGTNAEFMAWYGVLRALPSITTISKESQGTFTLFVNQASHYSTLLQKPSYEPKSVVDNTVYDTDFTITNFFDGTTAVFTAEDQIKHYHTIMAAMLKLGEWFDYLRENDVYDNTRIIVVADHGFPRTDLFGTKFSQSDFIADVLTFNSILLVKDFGSKATISADNTFMSNADTPLLAFEGLINNPINPSTGNPITNDAKSNPVHYLCITSLWNPDDNTGTTFLESALTWYSFIGDNIFDLSAWSEGRVD